MELIQNFTDILNPRPGIYFLSNGTVLHFIKESNSLEITIYPYLLTECWRAIQSCIPLAEHNFPSPLDHQKLSLCENFSAHKVSALVVAGEDPENVGKRIQSGVTGESQK